MTAQLIVSDLTLIRGERCLFKGVGFTLDSGELVLLEGQNGSGKTSLMRAIVGLADYEKGDIIWRGKSIRDSRDDFRAASVWTGHRVGCKADLTVAENLTFERCLRPSHSVHLDSVLERLAIARLKHLPLRALSAGQQRRVALARMLLSSAELWLVDEPFTNLDREGRDLVVSLVGQHLGRGGMCIMAAHQDVELDATVKRVVLG